MLLGDNRVNPRSLQIVGDIKIGNITFRVAKPCSRCVMTTVDTEKGIKTGKDPLKTLSEYRRTEGGVIFGQNLIHNGQGMIRVGDKVVVIEER